MMEGRCLPYGAKRRNLKKRAMWSECFKGRENNRRWSMDVGPMGDETWENSGALLRKSFDTRGRFNCEVKKMRDWSKRGRRA